MLFNFVLFLYWFFGLFFFFDYILRYDDNFFFFEFFEFFDFVFCFKSGERRESGFLFCDSWSLGFLFMDECDVERLLEWKGKRVLSDGVEDGKVEEDGDGDE